MSSLPILSGLSAAAETYPRLTEAQIARARPYARLRSVLSGDVLYVPGELSVPLYILLSSSVERVQPEVDGDRQVTMLLPRMFTGEAGMIGGQRAIVLAHVASAGEVLETSPKNLHALIARDNQLSGTLLRAFLLRRLTLVTKNLGNVILIGSRHSANTVRLREFLGRNGYPYTYVDLDTDWISQTLLDRFGVAIDEIPVVICNAPPFASIRPHNRSRR